MSDAKTILFENIKLKLLKELSTDLSKESFNTIQTILVDELSKISINESKAEIIPFNGKMNLDLINLFESSESLTGKSKGTVEQYKNAMLSFNKIVNKPLLQVNPMDIFSYLSKVKARGVSNSYLSSVRTYLSVFFNWCVNEELLNSNPVNKIDKISFKPTVKTAFSDVELESIRMACKDIRERTLIELLITSGVRAAELANLELSDIDFNKLSVSVRNGKGGKDRTTFITEVAADYLKKYVTQYNITYGKLFKTQKGDLTKDGVGAITKRIGRRVNVKANPHRFRHTFATMLAEKGMPIQEVSILLGHADVAVTMRYVHTNLTSVSNSYEKFANI